MWHTGMNDEWKMCLLLPRLCFYLYNPQSGLQTSTRRWWWQSHTSPDRGSSAVNTRPWCLPWPHLHMDSLITCKLDCNKKFTSPSPSLYWDYIKTKTKIIHAQGTSRKYGVYKYKFTLRVHTQCVICFHVFIAERFPYRDKEGPDVLSNRMTEFKIFFSKISPIQWFEKIK